MTVWRVLGLVLCGLLVVLAASTGHGSPAPTPADPAAPAAAPAPSSSPSSSPGSSTSDDAAALEVLTAWDRRRAAAWSDGDAESLRRLYVPGSRAGRADVRLLGTYAAAGVRVRRLTTQVFSVDVLERRSGLYRLRVVDRVAGGELVEAGRTRSLASGPVVTRLVELVRRTDGWRVRSATGGGRGRE